MEAQYLEIKVLLSLFTMILRTIRTITEELFCTA